MSNYPAGVSTRDIDNLCKPGDNRISAIICPTCKRELEELYTDLWYVDGERIPGGPLDAPKGRLACSQECLSQCVYNEASEGEKELLRSLARSSNEAFENVAGNDHIWLLRRSGILALVNAADIRSAYDDAMDLLKKLAGEDYINGDSDGPRWFMDAIAESNRILSTLKAVYEWADNHEDITETGHANDAMMVKGMIHDQLDDFIYREWKPEALKPAAKLEAGVAA
jgi:hypothetical protein